MPELKLVSIVTSSEAFEKFDASSLLDSRRHRPFKGRAGADSNVVIIKLAKEDVISFIDIGNEFTALLEILVGKSCYDNPVYSRLLETKFLMTPEDSKKEKNGNKWFHFSKDDFNPSVQAQKWDLIKIVCKQTFNSKIPYGLTFISVKGGEETSPIETLLTPLGCTLTPTATKIRKVPEKEEKRTFFDDIEDILEKENEEKLSPISISTGSLNIPRSADGMILDSRGKQRSFNISDEKRTQMFERWKHLKDERNKNLADKNSNSQQNEPSNQLKKRNSHAISLCDEDITKNHIKSEIQNTRTNPKKRLSEPSSPVQDKRVKTMSQDEEESPGASSLKIVNVAKSETTDKPKQPLVYKPNLVDPLKEVVFTLSGFQNPLRTQLREKAMSLGAVYANDLTPKVTHVVSAYRKTPKAKQAGSSVFVVSSFWVDRCVMERRRLDENLFSLKC